MLEAICAGRSAMKLAVVIPVLDELRALSATLESARGADEIVVVDGGSSDGSAELARATGATVVDAERGRGRQMNAGADASDGDVLLFLHADTLLPPGFRREVERALGDGAGWGRFDVRFDSAGWLLRLIAWLISARSRLTRGATGDQAIFVRRELFEAVGGYSEPQLFEDVALCRRLKRRAPMGVPASPVVTSSRRWRQDGAIRVSLQMWGLKALYLAGVPSDVLAGFYRRAR